jgi:hypothetical protein
VTGPVSSGTTVSAVRATGSVVKSAPGNSSRVTASGQVKLTGSLSASPAIGVTGAVSSRAAATSPARSTIGGCGAPSSSSAQAASAEWRKRRSMRFSRSRRVHSSKPRGIGTREASGGGSSRRCIRATSATDAAANGGDPVHSL